MRLGREAIPLALRVYYRTVVVGQAGGEGEVCTQGCVQVIVRGGAGGALPKRCQAGRRRVAAAARRRALKGSRQESGVLSSMPTEPGILSRRTSLVRALEQLQLLGD